MLIFDRAYTEIKNKYIVPLSSYAVQYRSLRSVNIKAFLNNKWISVEEDSPGVYLFHFVRDDLYKGVLGDIELFYIRQLIQSYDVESIRLTSISANWSIVTYYYNAFFAASLLLRLCHRGNIFLDELLRRNVEGLVSQVLGEVIKLDSNMFYEVIDNNSDKLLKLRSSGKSNTHELVWVEMDKLIDEMRLLSRRGSEEFVFLDAIKRINNHLQNTYPSKLRNRVNYQPIYGLWYLDKKLFVVNSKISWIDTILGFSDTSDDNQIACTMLAYSKYIEYLCNNLIAEYFQMKGNQNGIIKKINESRPVKLDDYSICYSFK